MPKFSVRSAVLAAVLAVGGCVSPPASPPSPPVAVPRPVPVPPTPSAPQPLDWRDWAVTPGDWSYRADVAGSVAAFGRSGGEALLTLRCDRGSSIVSLSRSGSGTAPLLVRTTSLARTLTALPANADSGQATVALEARDPLLDAMAFSRGRFIVEQPSAPTLVVPAWAEIGRVIEDCRR
jgi:hypothetical protein